MTRTFHLHGCSPHAIIFPSPFPGSTNLETDFMSQDNRSPVHIPGSIKYRTAEQGYLHVKAIILAKSNCPPDTTRSSPPSCKGEEVPALILDMTTLKEWKGLTSQFNITANAQADAEWQDQIVRTLCKMNFYKFRDAITGKNRSIRDKLLGTEDGYLVLACGIICPCDCGSGFHGTVTINHQVEWLSRLLGKTLMHIRAQVREAKDTGTTLPDLTEDGIELAANTLLCIDDGPDLDPRI